jgi:hypothetical protein
LKKNARNELKPSDFLFLCPGFIGDVAKFRPSKSKKPTIMLIHLIVVSSIFLTFVSVQWLTKFSKPKKQHLKRDFAEKQEAAA